MSPRNSQWTYRMPAGVSGVASQSRGSACRTSLLSGRTWLFRMLSCCIRRDSRTVVSLFQNRIVGEQVAEFVEQKTCPSCLDRFGRSCKKADADVFIEGQRQPVDVQAVFLAILRTVSVPVRYPGSCRIQSSHLVASDMRPGILFGRDAVNAHRWISSSDLSGVYHSIRSFLTVPMRSGLE